MGNKIYYLNDNKQPNNGDQATSATYKKQLLIYLLLILIFVVILTLFNRPGHRLFVAKYGELVDGFETGGLVIRKEKVVKAPVSGEVSLVQDEGERVAHGSKIMEIDNATTSITLYNSQPGVISFATDGLEGLTPDRIQEISLQEYRKFSRDYQQLLDGEEIEAGQPAFRIVDNFQLYVLLEVQQSAGDRFTRGETVFVRPLNFDRGLIKGQVISLDYYADSALVGVKLNGFVDEWLSQRRVEVELIKDIYRGTIIPRQAIFTDSRGSGVLVYTLEGNYKFTEIEIEDKTEEMAVVSGIDSGERVVLNPGDFEYGRGEA
ncbi:MAG: HlyD family efflux transporter periplasmic adaptor subunit [Bacillota bacterium]